MELPVRVGTPKEILLQWLAAFNNADIDSISALYAGYATYNQVARAPVVGKAAIRTMFEREFEAAGTTNTPDNIFEDGEWAMLEWYDPNGLRGCSFFHVIGGEIVFQRSYRDPITR